MYVLCKTDVPKPDIIIACSGSAATSVCYVSNQCETIKEVWCNLLSTKKFVNFWRFWNIVSIDYLVDVILKKKITLNIKKMIDSPIEVYFPLTNSINGKIEYISNKMKLDFWEVFRATKTVPIFTHLFSIKGVLINKKYYSDSLASTRFQLHVDKAIKEGAKRIFVFDSWHPDDNPSKFFFTKIFVYMRNSKYRKNQLNYLKKIKNFSIPKDVEFIRFSPKTKLGMSPLEINNKNAREIFKRGYEETIKSKKMEEIFEK